MYQTKETAQDILKAAKRRRVLLIITPILFTGLSIAALHLIEPKYTSSTSILVQKEETLNPLILYEMAVNIASEDRLKSFNEIIYSRSTMEMLIDSLDLSEGIATEVDKQSLITALRSNISTTSRASDSFEISYSGTDPVKARDAVAFLADHFISTRLQLENRRNNETVEFFSIKLDELEQIVDEQRDQVVSSTSGRMRQLPMDDRALQARLQNTDSQIETLEWQIYQEEQKLEIVRNYLGESEQSAQNIQQLYRLPLEDTPFGEELSELLREYGELSQQYTESYPRVRAVSSQISQLAGRMPAALESGLARLNRQREDLSRQRIRVIDDMEQSFVAGQRSRSRQSDFSIYEQLYNEMKIKLEQARMTRDIGDRAAEQFIVLDAPFIPEEPSSPNRRLVLALGLMSGLIIGVIISAVAEVMDTTIRDVEDLQYEKPIIAYLADG